MKLSKILLKGLVMFGCGVASRVMLVLLAAMVCADIGVAQSTSPKDKLQRDKFGAIIRGDVNAKKLALIFTGDEYGESTEPILDALKQRRIKAAFFVTGNFIRQNALRPLLKQAITEGHYVGPHSDSHPLYASWDERDKSLITQDFFKKDLQKNIVDLRAIGSLRGDQPILFIPPYEHYNGDHVRWSRQLRVTLFNFTPGSGSNRDYAREGDPRFVPSRKIYDDILAFEKTNSRGLNGFLLLMHLGSGRKDPFHPMLGPLCDELSNRGYVFERVDHLLR
jgi:peptidoglycan/xylan/chitin deacetylase (PgdA/CDA1 family)